MNTASNTEFSVLSPPVRKYRIHLVPSIMTDETPVLLALTGTNRDTWRVSLCAGGEYL